MWKDLAGMSRIYEQSSYVGNRRMKLYTNEEMREAITFEMGDRFGEVFDLWLEKHNKAIYEHAAEIAQERSDDMMSCTKDDDCHVKAYGAYLAADDIRSFAQKAGA